MPRLGYGLRDGSQKGKKEGGLRRNINLEPCTDNGPGFSRGGGRGKGKIRKE